MGLRNELPDFLQDNPDDWFTAQELADELGYSDGWVHDVSQDLDEVDEKLGNRIVAHEIPGRADPVVLGGDRDDLLELVKSVDSSKLAEAKRQPTVDKLRDFIEEEIAQGTVVFPNRRRRYKWSK